MIPVSNSYQQYFDLDGSPLDSGSIYIGVENANPVTSPVQAYFDEAMTIPAAQPLQTMNGYIVRNGSPARIWVDQNAYSIRVNNKRGEVVYSALRATLYRFDSSEFVTYTPDGIGAVSTTVQAKLRESVSVKDFGAIGDGVVDDTTASQAAFDACPPGGEVIFPTASGERYRITDEIRITKPVTVRGSAAGNVYGDYTASSADTFTGIQQTNTAKSAFKLVASLENYAFNQYGILGVHFKDLMISGPSGASYAVSAVCADTAINGGNFHIRHCHMDNVVVRYFTTGVDYTGIAYLNTFVNTLVYNCTTGWRIARGAASDNGGQNRWFGCTGISCGTVASLGEDSTTGSYAFFGCTLSESQCGIRADEECVLTVSGCEFESLTNSGNGAGIYINIAESNPNSSAAKTIVGNKFLTNDADIWIDKTTTTFSGGGFAWPMLIDGNTFNSANALKITVPVGHTGIDSKQLVFGAANAGPNGLIQASQISANFLGTDLREYPYGALKNISNSFLISYYGTGVANTFLASVDVPSNSTLYLDSIKRYSINTTTGVRGNASIDAIDDTPAVRITSFGSANVAQLSWVNTTGATRTVRIRANDGTTGNPYAVFVYVRVAP